MISNTLLVPFLLVAFINSNGPAGPDTQALPEAGSGAAAATQLATCTVTEPNGQMPPGEGASGGHYGNGELWTVLWPEGTVVFRPGGPGFVLTDGSLQMKFPWWRAVPGLLTINGRRLDAPAPPLRAYIPSGYSASGFQATSLIFPTPGCWEVAEGSRTGGLQPWVGMGSAKAALESLVRYFAVTLAKRGITVNAISPGWTEDSVLNSLPQQAQDLIRNWHARGWTPMGRLGTPEDIGNVASLFCAEQAGWITGQVIYADGGASLMNPEVPPEIQLG